jgi:hypothetical protein
MKGLANLQELISSPYSGGAKKFLFQILQEKYADHEPWVERIAENVKTAKDYEAMGKLFLAVYEAAYLKAVEQHREILEKHGLRVTVSQSAKLG